MRLFKKFLLIRMAVVGFPERRPIRNIPHASSLLKGIKKKSFLKTLKIEG